MKDNLNNNEKRVSLRERGVGGGWRKGGKGKKRGNEWLWEQETNEIISETKHIQWSSDDNPEYWSDLLKNGPQICVNFDDFPCDYE